MPYLSQTVDIFSQVVNPDKQSNSGELLAALISCEQVVFASNDWRTQEKFIDQMSAITKIFSSDQIYSKLVPRIFDKLHKAVSN